VFLDEVQEVPEWQRLVRALVDRQRAVCVTGSNASLVGRELGTRLTAGTILTRSFRSAIPSSAPTRELNAGTSRCGSISTPEAFPDSYVNGAIRSCKSCCGM
jgi:hypothetical protein